MNASATAILATDPYSAVAAVSGIIYRFIELAFIRGTTFPSFDCGATIRFSGIRRAANR